MRLGVQDGVSIPPTTASRMLALPWAISQHARLPGAPPSWRAWARRRLHPPTTALGIARLPAPSWGQDLPPPNHRQQAPRGDDWRRHPTLACKTAGDQIGQHGRLPGAPPSWGQDLGLQDGVSTPQPPPAGCWRSQGRSGSTDDSRERRHLGGSTLACETASPPPNHRQQDAGAPRGDQAARTTPGSAAILAAGRWLARRRLHPPNHRQQVAGGPMGDRAAWTTPGSAAILGAGPWLARRRLHPPTTASRLLAVPGAIRQHGRLPGAPPSWRQYLGLQDGVSNHHPRPAGCWRSQ